MLFAPEQTDARSAGKTAGGDDLPDGTKNMWVYAARLELVQIAPLPVVQYTLVCIPQLHIWLMQGSPEH